MDDKTGKLKESERHFRLMADAAPMLVWTTDHEKMAAWFNQTALAFMGRGLEQVIGKGWRAVVHPDDLQQCVEKFEHDFDLRLPCKREFRIKCSDGQYHWILDSASPRFDESGNFVGYIGSAVDINDRVEAEAKLRTLSTAIEQSPTAVVITDVHGNIEYVNPRFTEVTGYTSQEAIGRNPRILQSGLTSQEIYRELWGNISSGRFWHGELFNKRRNGELYWEATHIAPVKDAAGTILHYVAVKTDITGRKKTERALVEQEQRLRQEQSTFFSFVTHEMRTPLGVVLAGLANLRRGLADAGDGNLATIARVTGAARRIEDLIDRHLRLQSLSQADFKASCDAHAADLPVRQVIAAMREMHPLRSFECRVLESVPDQVSMDADLVQIALSNLLDNAVKYSPADAPIRVEIDHQRISLGLSLRLSLIYRVIDQGPGIPLEQQQSILQPYYRSPQTAKGKLGFGIGLAVVQQVARAHGGSLNCISSPGRETVFALSIPTDRMPPNPSAMQEEA